MTGGSSGGFNCGQKEARDNGHERGATITLTAYNSTMMKST
jgi:hypothetical protein